MRWQGRRSSQNVEDRRGSGIARKAGGGGIGVIVLALIAMYFGVDPSIILNQGGGMLGGSGTESVQYQPTEEEQQLAGFVSVVLADTEDAWNRVFERMGRRYQEPKLVLFSGSVESACGLGQAAMGPFYCPADQKAYIDLSFYRDLKLRHQAPGILPRPMSLLMKSAITFRICWASQVKYSRPDSSWAGPSPMHCR